MFSKDKLNNQEIKSVVANVLGVKEKDIHIVDQIDDWLNKEDNQLIVIQYSGYLNEDENKEDKYYGYHYYNVWYEDSKVSEKLMKLETAFKTEVIIDME